jgi:hypothetical protein
MTFHRDGSLQAHPRTLLYAGRAVDLAADVGQMTGLSGTPGQAANIMRLPAPLLCY